jgi:tetratricopeptide (TPR) repeat protein
MFRILPMQRGYFLALITCLLTFQTAIAARLIPDKTEITVGETTYIKLDADFVLTIDWSATPGIAILDSSRSGATIKGTSAGPGSVTANYNNKKKTVKIQVNPVLPSTPPPTGEILYQRDNAASSAQPGQMPAWPEPPAINTQGVQSGTLMLPPPDLPPADIQAILNELAQNAKKLADLAVDKTDAAIGPGRHAGSAASHGGGGQALDEWAKYWKNLSQGLDNRGNKLTRDQWRGMFEGADKAAQWEKYKNWFGEQTAKLEKLGRAISIVDSGSKVAGALYGGGAQVAAVTLADEICKTGAVAFGGLFGAPWGPFGSVAGAAAGEELWGAFGHPEFERKAQFVKNLETWNATAGDKVRRTIGNLREFDGYMQGTVSEADFRKAVHAYAEKYKQANEKREKQRQKEVALLRQQAAVEPGLTPLIDIYESPAAKLSPEQRVQLKEALQRAIQAKKAAGGKLDEAMQCALPAPTDSSGGRDYTAVPTPPPPQISNQQTNDYLNCLCRFCGGASGGYFTRDAKSDCNGGCTCWGPLSGWCTAVPTPDAATRSCAASAFGVESPTPELIRKGLDLAQDANHQKLEANISKHLAANNLDGAIALAEDALKAEPNLFSPMLREVARRTKNAGWEAFNKSDEKTAIKRLEQAYSLDPNDADTQSKLQQVRNHAAQPPGEANWAVAETTPGMYRVERSAGQVRIARQGNNPGGLQHAGLRLDPKQPVAGDFDTQVSFSNAQIEGGLNQIELQASFADGSIFFVVRDREGSGSHIWAPGLQGNQPCSQAGTLRMERRGDTVTGYCDGRAIWSSPRKAALTRLQFVLQNNGTNDPISVTFRDYRFNAATTGTGSLPVQAPAKAKPVLEDDKGPYTWVEGTEVQTKQIHAGRAAYRSTGNNHFTHRLGIAGNYAEQYRYLDFWIYLMNPSADIQLQVQVDGVWGKRWGFDADAAYNGYGWAMEGTTAGLASGRWLHQRVDLLQQLHLDAGQAITGLAFSSDAGDVYYDSVYLLPNDSPTPPPRGVLNGKRVLEDDAGSYNWVEPTTLQKEVIAHGKAAFRSTGNNHFTGELGVVGDYPEQFRSLSFWLFPIGAEADIQLQVQVDGVWGKRWGFEAGPKYNGFGSAMEGTTTGLKPGQWQEVSVDLLNQLHINPGQKITGMAFSSDNGDVYYDSVYLHPNPNPARKPAFQPAGKPVLEDSNAGYNWVEATEVQDFLVFNGAKAFRSTGNNHFLADLGLAGSGSGQFRHLNFWAFFMGPEADVQVQVQVNGTWGKRWGYDAGPVYNGFGGAMEGNSTRLPNGRWTNIQLDLIGQLHLKPGDRITGLAFSSDNADVIYDSVYLLPDGATPGVSGGFQGDETVPVAPDGGRDYTYTPPATPQTVIPPASDGGRCVNLARGKHASQSSTSQWSHANDAEGALDGIINGSYAFHTNNERNPWWQVDLGNPASLTEVRIFNRLDCCAERAQTLQVLLSDDARSWRTVYRHSGNAFGGKDGKQLVVRLAGESARYLRLQLNETNWFHLDEVEVCGEADASPSGRDYTGQEPVVTQGAVLFDNGNIAGVGNGPSQPTRFSLNSAHVITLIQDYHWNSARGAAPGTISLRDANGRIYGPWQSVGSPGQGGVPNAYWTVHPGEMLPTGTYTVIDSHPASWSHNSDSQQRGFTRVEGYPANDGQVLNSGNIKAKTVSPGAAEPSLKDQAGQAMKALKDLFGK